MRKVLLTAILFVGSLASGGALGLHGFAVSVGGRGIVALVRDDGRYANSPLKSWFDRLASGNGLCCSFADGFRVDDVDWDAEQTPNGRLSELMPSYAIHKGAKRQSKRGQAGCG
jgi:hypothetical protein